MALTVEETVQVCRILGSASPAQKQAFLHGLAVLDFYEKVGYHAYMQKIQAWADAYDQEPAPMSPKEFKTLLDEALK